MFDFSKGTTITVNDVARHVWVSGFVQGVAFRHYTTIKARALDVRGWVKNLPDGSVEVWAEGGRAAVESLVAWLSKGPPMAQVTDKRVVEAVPVGAERFEVRHEG